MILELSKGKKKMSIESYQELCYGIDMLQKHTYKISSAETMTEAFRQYELARKILKDIFDYRITTLNQYIGTEGNYPLQVEEELNI